MTEIIKITGVIEDKITKESPADAEKEWKRFAFKIAGKTFSSFDVTNDAFKVGDVVEVEYTTTDGPNGIVYKNITKMKKVDVDNLPDEAVPVEKVPQATPSKPNTYIDRDAKTEASITSNVIIKAVTDMVCAGRVEPGAFKTNAGVLIKIYKDTKKELLE